jgi:hypothetical protein
MHSDKWRKTFRALFGRAEFQRSSKDTTMWSEMFLTVLHLGVSSCNYRNSNGGEASETTTSEYQSAVFYSLDAGHSDVEFFVGVIDGVTAS